MAKESTPGALVAVYCDMIAEAKKHRISWHGEPEIQSLLCGVAINIATLIAALDVAKIGEGE